MWSTIRMKTRITGTALFFRIYFDKVLVIFKSRADELNEHSPTTIGWQSPKNTKYPQELGFEIDSSGRVEISTVQLEPII